jgi:predicted nuclease with RNAse H fold
MKRGQTVVGIDVALSRPCVAAAMVNGRVGDPDADWRVAQYADDRSAGDVAALIEWLLAREAAVVAIDAPQAPRRPKDALRACDAELRHLGIPLYQVPARGEPLRPSTTWMKAGWTLFSRLEKGAAGFQRPETLGMPGSFGTPPAALEVYPHASFTLLSWKRKLGSGRPLPRLAHKGSRLGIRQRIEILEAEGVEWRYYYDHDSLDALAAALTAWRFVQGQACSVGDDALIWLPLAAADLERIRQHRNDHGVVDARMTARRGL